MSDVVNMIVKGLEELGFFEWIKERIKIGPAWKAKSAAYFFVPGLISLSFIIYGGGLSIDFGKGLAISELKSEISKERASSSKRAVLIIAEPVALDAYVTVTNNSARIWTSLDEERAQRNVERQHFGLDGSTLHVKARFFQAEEEPVAVVVEGEVADEFEVNGKTESVRNWRLSSRRSGAIVAAVLINCFMALGVGLATGVAAPVHPDKNDGRKKRTEPNKE